VEARLVATVDARRPWADAGYRSTAAWLAASDNSRLDDAHSQVRLARRLRTMPAVAAALAAGDISAAHAQRLASLNGPLTAAAFAQAEAYLVGQARTLRWADFIKACAYWLRQARQDGPDPDKADHDHRHVSLHDGLRGTGILTGELTPVAKATVAAALARIEQELFEADWAAAKAVHGDATTTAHLGRTPRQRRHDALAEMARRAITAPADGKRPQPLITVLAGYQAFTQICELADGTLISPATAARLLDDAVIERIVFDGPSRVIDLGHARSFTGAARRAVEIIDRHCQGPGCHIPAHQCQIDHRWRHHDGGPTHPDNGDLLCGFHNRDREHPKPRRPGRTLPDTTPQQRAAHLELLRQRIRDQCLHDPDHGWNTDPSP
ncbi:MAG: DUF222 domain-containing protein, partial [Acidimicrobiales bacterium]